MLPDATPQTPPASTIQFLEDLYAMRDLLMLDKQAQIKQIIPDDVAMELDAIEDEFSNKEELIAKRIKDTEDFLKAQAVSAGEKIIGANFYVQYTKGGKQVKVEDVLRVADRFDRTHPEIAAEMRAIITMKKASATIKAVGT
jgi:hypothetical protein